MVRPKSTLLLLKGKALTEGQGLVVQWTHWDVLALDWIHQKIGVEVLVWCGYADWKFLDRSGLMLELGTGVGKRGKSAVAGQEGLEVQYFVFVLIEGRVDFAAFLALERVISQQAHYNRMQETAVFLTKQLQVVIHLVSLDLPLPGLPAVNRVHILQSPRSQRTQSNTIALRS